MHFRIGKNVSAPDRQQGSQQPAIPVPQRPGAANTSASQQVQQQGLCTVPAVMPQGDPIRLNTGEGPMPSTSCRGFQAVARSPLDQDPFSQQGNFCSGTKG